MQRNKGGKVRKAYLHCHAEAQLAPIFGEASNRKKHSCFYKKIVPQIAQIIANKVVMIIEKSTNISDICGQKILRSRQKIFSFKSGQKLLITLLIPKG
jgi:hypothetical protein